MIISFSSERRQQGVHGEPYCRVSEESEMIISFSSERRQQGVHGELYSRANERNEREFISEKQIRFVNNRMA
jgi:hypothetical protein